MVLIDSRKKRDGAAIEQLGWYNPISDEKDCELKSERIIHWLNKGAQPSKAAKKLIKNKGISFEWHLMKSGADEKEIQKQLKKRDLEKAAGNKKKNESRKVDVKPKKDTKESVQISEKDNKLSTDANPKEDSSSRKEVDDTSKTDASSGSKEEE